MKKEIKAILKIAIKIQNQKVQKNPKKIMIKKKLVMKKKIQKKEKLKKKKN